MKNAQGTNSMTGETIQTGENSKSLPPGVQRDMRIVRAKLREIVTVSEVNRWLQSPNLKLQGLTPAAAVAQGKTTLVLEMIAAVAEGVYV